MKVLILTFAFGFFLPTNDDDCTVRISDGTNTVICTSGNCADARACAIAGWEAMD